MTDRLAQLEKRVAKLETAQQKGGPAIVYKVSSKLDHGFSVSHYYVSKEDAYSRAEKLATAHATRYGLLDQLVHDEKLMSWTIGSDYHARVIPEERTAKNERFIVRQGIQQ